MKAMNISKDVFQKEVLEAKETVLVDFWSPGCVPCMMLMPEVEKAAEEMTDVKVCKVNVDDEQGLAMEYRVMSIPTLMVFKGGKQVKTSIGVVSGNEIKELVK